MKPKEIPKLIPEWIAERRKDGSLWRRDTLTKCLVARFVRDGMYVEVISPRDEAITEEEARIIGAQVMGTTDPLEIYRKKQDTCMACDTATYGCECAETLADGCFRCSPDRYERPPCPPLCRNYRPSVWERLV